ncbi:hypothetical protein Tco_1505287 [Tanacetum coccineum]
MSSGLSASMAEVAAMSESAFRKRFRSSYESSPSVSPPDLPLRKRYRGTSELVEDSEEEDDEEDEEIEEKDEDPAAEDKGLTAGVEGPDMHDEGYGLDDEIYDMDDESHCVDDEGHSVESDGLSLEEEEEAVLGGQQQASFAQFTFEVGQGSGSAPESERPERVSAFRQPTLTIWTDPEYDMVYIDVPTYPPPAPPVQTPPYRFVWLEELSPAMFERSLEYEQERVAVRFGAIWRPVLALESWAGQTDAQRAALWHAISDVQGENQDLQLQLAEERRARLELVEVIDGMRRGQEPKGDA